MTLVALKDRRPNFIAMDETDPPPFKSKMKSQGLPQQGGLSSSNSDPKYAETNSKATNPKDAKPMDTDLEEMTQNTNDTSPTPLRSSYSTSSSGANIARRDSNIAQTGSPQRNSNIVQRRDSNIVQQRDSNVSISSGRSPVNISSFANHRGFPVLEGPGWRERLNSSASSTSNQSTRKCSPVTPFGMAGPIVPTTTNERDSQWRNRKNESARIKNSSEQNVQNGSQSGYGQYGIPKFSGKGQDSVSWRSNIFSNANSKRPFIEKNIVPILLELDLLTLRSIKALIGTCRHLWHQSAKQGWIRTCIRRGCVLPEERPQLWFHASRAGKVVDFFRENYIHDADETARENQGNIVSNGKENSLTTCDAPTKDGVAKHDRIANSTHWEAFKTPSSGSTDTKVLNAYKFSKKVPSVTRDGQDRGTAIGNQTQDTHMNENSTSNSSSSKPKRSLKDIYSVTRIVSNAMGTTSVGGQNTRRENSADSVRGRQKCGKNQLSPLNIFDIICKNSLPETKELEISRDVGRTFPYLPHFASSEGSHSEGRATLHRLLRAVSLAFPEMGYCQGQNFVAGVLLIHCDFNISRSFWILCAMLEFYDYRLLFSPKVPLLAYRSYQFHGLIEDSFPPQLHALFQKYGLSVDILSQQWIMTAFAYVIDPILLGSLWDAMFLDAWFAIFEVGLGLLSIMAPKIMRAESMEHLSTVINSQKKTLRTYFEEKFKDSKTFVEFSPSTPDVTTASSFSSTLGCLETSPKTPVLSGDDTGSFLQKFSPNTLSAEVLVQAQRLVCSTIFKFNVKEGRIRQLGDLFLAHRFEQVLKAIKINEIDMEVDNLNANRNEKTDSKTREVTVQSRKTAPGALESKNEIPDKKDDDLIKPTTVVPAAFSPSHVGPPIRVRRTSTLKARFHTLPEGFKFDEKTNRLSVDMRHFTCSDVLFEDGDEGKKGEKMSSHTKESTVKLSPSDNNSSRSVSKDGSKTASKQPSKDVPTINSALSSPADVVSPTDVPKEETLMSIRRKVGRCAPLYRIVSFQLGDILESQKQLAKLNLRVDRDICVLQKKIELISHQILTTNQKIRETGLDEAQIEKDTIQRKKQGMVDLLLDVFAKLAEEEDHHIFSRGSSTAAQKSSEKKGLKIKSPSSQISTTTEVVSTNSDSTMVLSESTIKSNNSSEATTKKSERGQTPPAKARYPSELSNKAKRENKVRRDSLLATQALLQEQITEISSVMVAANERYTKAMEAAEPLQEELFELEDQKQRFSRDLTSILRAGDREKDLLLLRLWEKYSVTELPVPPPPPPLVTTVKADSKDTESANDKSPPSKSVPPKTQTALPTPPFAPTSVIGNVGKVIESPRFSSADDDNGI